ncbi:ABC transporter substrate-binding protein [Desulfuribacillus stibiiarsenatis]|uniref:ABC transporter substrate-binding protein n=1 Tax=Desulfuribacillus stibiiarsenatis TaxID=1390249 RepID=UPI000AE79D93|nr:MqnA/MqnD/SBP family protein [Desulfuribacillus stibiiarsenatis]
MKITKQILSLALIMFLTMVLIACEIEEKPVSQSEDKQILRIATLKGPTGMGMVQLIENNLHGKTQLHYDITLYDSPDAMIGKIVNGEVDIAAVPSNVALLLYNRTNGAVQLAGVNTLGVLYVLENGQKIQTVEDLKGNQIGISGKGATPDFITRYILEQNGIKPDEDVQLEFKLEHADLATAMAAGDVKIAVLPQPHVTTAIAKNPQIRVALDLNQQWSSSTGGNILPMGSIVVQKSIAQSNPELIHTFLEEYNQSVTFVNEQMDLAAEWMEKHNILPKKEIARKAIPDSNIVLMKAVDAKPYLEHYYQTLFDYEPKSVGGKLADEGFYFQ